MTCKQTQTLLSAHLDRDLKNDELSEVRLHLETCAACRAEEQALVALKETLRGVAMPAIPVDLIAAIEAETIFKPQWWETVAFRQRWAPLLIGTAAAVGGWFFLRGHSDVQRGIPIQMVVAPDVVSTAPAIVMHRDQEPEPTEKIH